MSFNLPPDVASNILAEIKVGNMISAIKLYREAVPGTGLADAKAAVESMVDGLWSAATPSSRPQAPKPTANPVVPPALGCAWMFALTGAGAVAAKLLLVAGSHPDSPLEQRWKEVMTDTLLVATAFQSAVMLVTPRRQILGYFGLAVTFFLLASKIYLTLQS